jgi:starvation-inducible outer membrane lipoprotein
MKRKVIMMLLLGSSFLVQACASVPETDPDKDAAHKRANREEYAERIQD